LFRTEDPDETESSAESGGDGSDDELEAPASVEITSGSGSKKKTVTWKRVTDITEDIRTDHAITPSSSLVMDGLNKCTYFVCHHEHGSVLVGINAAEWQEDACQFAWIGGQGLFVA
jgi:hypothetical protein